MPDCTLILVHGIGNQKKTWSNRFQTRLRAALGADARRVQIRDAYWAPLSTVKETFRPTLAARGRPTGLAVEDELYDRTYLEFMRMLALDAGAPVDAHTFGLGDIWNAITKQLRDAPDIAADVANYVARNGVRTGVQHVLHQQLAAAHAAQAPVIVVAHSQGTVISYDVLRQAGENYPLVKAWVTMGSPLRKYFAFPLQWGRRQLGVPSSLRWLNLYDKRDIVGKDLRAAVDWPRPQPTDRSVDNQRNAANAHDHWGNPQVLKAVTDEVRKMLTAR
jgi:pimeloyl-ACP methyl ester carboxylesterase